MEQTAQQEAENKNKLNMVTTEAHIAFHLLCYFISDPTFY